MPGEMRWIILTPNGGHVSIGRHTDPIAPAEIAALHHCKPPAGPGVP